MRVRGDAGGDPQLHALVTRCFELLSAQYPRVGLQLKADWRNAPGGRLKAKTAKIEERLGRKLST